jgi:hypothetical protein
MSLLGDEPVFVAASSLFLGVMGGGKPGEVAFLSVIS